MSQEAVVKERKSIYVVWIIPIVAMLIAGWMIFKYYDAKGYDIVVTFNGGEGITAGKTPLIYNGIQLGLVSKVDINLADLSKVDVTITVDKAAMGVGRKGNIFWKVEPNLSLTEVSGLSTILSGVYIGVMPASNDAATLLKFPKETKFMAAESEPVNVLEPGLFITLHAKTSDIKAGAPVMFRKIDVGKVIEVNLADTGVDYVVRIDSKYANLIKENSNFWKASGVEVRASLAGLRVEMDSLATVVAGGIAFDSPEGKAVEADFQGKYRLFDDLDEVKLDHETITLTSTSGYNIDEKSSNVYFKGMNAGDIIAIDYDPISDQTTFKIKLKSSFKHLAHKGAYFWIVTPELGLSSVKGLDAIVRGAYIAFDVKKKSGEAKKTFNLHYEPMPVSGKHFTLLSKRSHALKAGVNVVYSDVPIGTIRSVKLNKKKKRMEFDVVVRDQYAHLVNNSSAFYVEQAVESEISLDKIYFNVGSLETIVNGGIVLKTDDPDEKSTKRKFELLNNYAAYEEKKYFQSGGKTFSLTADALGSLKKGSPVAFKGINVGKVTDYVLNKNSDKVDLKIYIEPKYADRVNASTKFYNISGVEVKAGLDGLKIRTDSIESMVSGGIAFKTPLKESTVDEMHRFTLYTDEDQADENYVRITLQMDRGFNLKAGSAIVYKSMTVGRIKSMKLENETVNAIALVDQEYSTLFTKDSVLWIEDFEADMMGVKNASSMISGPFLELLPGKNSELGDHFFVTDTPPAPTINKEGLRVVVSGSRLSSLKVGSPIFFRQIKIGSVEEFRLSDDSTSVELMLYIDKCHAYLVRQNSVFYNATAMGMDVSLFGVKVSTETISTMVKGGITLVTPDVALERAEEMRAYKLYDKPEESWLAWSPKLVNNEMMCE